MKFNSDKYNGFIVKSKSGSIITFSCDARGIYVKDPRPNEECCHNMVEGFTDKEVERAKQCQKFLHDLDVPSYSDLKSTTRMNLIKNNPVITEDVKLAEDVFGKDVSVLKGTL